MGQIWFRFGSSLVQVWFKFGSGLVQLWFSFGSALVQLWFSFGSARGPDLVQIWFKGQICLKRVSDLSVANLVQIRFVIGRTVKGLRPITN